MIAIKYTSNIEPVLPENGECSGSAVMLKCLAAAMTAGVVEDEVFDWAKRAYAGEDNARLSDFIAQDMKISIPISTVASALESILDLNNNTEMFETRFSWPVITDSAFKSECYIKDAIIYMKDLAPEGIRVPVLRLLQKASEYAKYNRTSITDSLVISLLSSYYSAFDLDFRLIFFPFHYTWATTHNAVLFDAAGALCDGVAKTAVYQISGTSAWLGMLVDSKLPIPSLLTDFFARTGASSGVNSNGFTDIQKLLSRSTTLEDTLHTCLDMEGSRSYDITRTSTQPVIEMIVCDCIEPGIPVSVKELVFRLIKNMTDDLYMLNAWEDYCLMVGNHFYDNYQELESKPCLSFVNNDMRSEAIEILKDNDGKILHNLFAILGYTFHADTGNDLAVLSSKNYNALAEKIDSETGMFDLMVDNLRLGDFSVPTVYQDLFIINMKKAGRDFIAAEDITAVGGNFNPDDMALIDESIPRHNRYTHLDPKAASYLAVAGAMFRAVVMQAPVPEASLSEMYAECLGFTYDAIANYQSEGLLCSDKDIVSAALSEVSFSPNSMGIPVDALASALAQSIVGPIGNQATVIAKYPLSNHPMPGRRTSGSSHRSGKMLTTFCTDMLDQARKGEIGQHVLGREDIIEQVKSVLLRRDKSNPLLLAPAGAGKTAVVEGLAKKIIDEEAGPLNGFGVYSLDVSSLVADSPTVGALGARVKDLIEEAISTNSILFIDEIHTIVAIGNGEFNLGNVMKPYLARHGLKVIGATTEREHGYTIAKDKALDRRFSPIHLPRLEFDALVEIISAKSMLYAKHHGVMYNPEMSKVITLLSEDYMGSRESPDRELDVLDVSGAITAADGRIEVEERDIVDAVKLLTANKSIKTRKDVARELVADVSKEDMDKAFPNVAAQYKAKADIMRRISESKLDISSRNKPRNIFMFVGDSGVGKTYMAYEMAPLLDASSDDVLPIALGEYKDRASYTRLVGANPQYVGYQEGGVLTNFAKAHPSGIVILDEIDKCDPTIQDMFLGVFDTGFLRASDGSVVDCRSLTFVCTANTGFGASKKNAIGFGLSENAERQEMDNVKESLRQQFGEPLMNRIDEVVFFDALTKDDLVEICKISYRKLVDKMNQRYGVDLAQVYSEADLDRDARERFEKADSDLDARTAWGPFEKEIVPKALELLK